MEVKPESDASVVYSVMTNPDIWERISDDNSDLESFQPPRSQLYLTARQEGEIVGVARFVPVNSALVEYHPMVLPEMRKYSVEFHDKTITAIKEILGDVQLTVSIPDCFKDVFYAAARNNWKRVGKLKNSIQKHNKLHDIHIMQYCGEL